MFTRTRRDTLTFPVDILLDGDAPAFLPGGGTVTCIRPHADETPGLRPAHILDRPKGDPSRGRGHLPEVGDSLDGLGIDVLDAEAAPTWTDPITIAAAAAVTACAALTVAAAVAVARR